MVARSFDAGWGGAVLKTMAYDLRMARNVNPRIAAYKVGKSIHGFTNFELGSPKPISKWLEDARWLKERFPEHAVFVSLLHTEGLVEEQWREVTRMFNDAGIDGFELNFSCSHGMAEAGGGAQVGGNEEAIKMVTNWVRSETNLPVMPKLPAMVPNIGSKARAAEEAGADAIATINTLNSIPGIDIYNFVPYPTVDGKSAFSGMSGRAIKPIALRTVAPGRQGRQHSGLRYRRHIHMAGCGRVHPRGRVLSAGLFRGHGERLQVRRGDEQGSP